MPAHQFIRDALSGSSIPADLIQTATDYVEPALLAAWFKMPLRPAAVLVPLTERGGELQMLLTERTHTVSDHPGQVAFPGGTAEQDDPDLVFTALRESAEEIGLLPEQVEIVGYLPAQAVISGYAVLPVVGFYEHTFKATIDPGEVASVFEVPLAFLRDTNNLVRVDREKNGVMLPTYEYHYQGHMIWGATALMIRRFVALLA
jgi:8-oxo-dGTP pyrophosphatase MutT (NUDIX family)